MFAQFAPAFSNFIFRINFNFQHIFVSLKTRGDFLKFTSINVKFNTQNKIINNIFVLSSWHGTRVSSKLCNFNRKTLCCSGIVSGTLAWVFTELCCQSLLAQWHMLCPINGFKYWFAVIINNQYSSNIYCCYCFSVFTLSLFDLISAALWFEFIYSWVF